ncbi:MAG: hypothetical protein P1U89_02545 [Verrucomicrobiales bacterium]|nr:hypothetical protein [Verrucomicrobiales bacterium]
MAIKKLWDWFFRAEAGASAWSLVSDEARSFVKYALLSLMAYPLAKSETVIEKISGDPWLAVVILIPALAITSILYLLIRILTIKNNPEIVSKKTFPKMDGMKHSKAGIVIQNVMGKSPLVIGAKSIDDFALFGIDNTSDKMLVLVFNKPISSGSNIKINWVSESGDIEKSENSIDCVTPCHARVRVPNFGLSRSARFQVVIS